MRFVYIVWVLLLASLPGSPQTALQVNPKPISKTPAEQFFFAMDFTQMIQSDGIALVSVTAINSRTGADSTSIVIGTNPAPSIIPGTDKIAFMLQGGQPNDLHHITVLATDVTTGAQFAGKLNLSISNWP